MSLVCFNVNYPAAILLQELTASQKSTNGVISNAMTFSWWPRIFLNILLLEAAVDFLHCERNHENHQYKGLAAPAGAGPGPDCDWVQPDLPRRAEIPRGLPFRLPGEGRTEPLRGGESRFTSTFFLSIPTMSIHSLPVCRRSVHPTVFIASHTTTGVQVSKLRHLPSFARSALARTSIPGVLQMARSTAIDGELRALRFGWGTPQIIPRYAAAEAVSAFRVFSVAVCRILAALFCVCACML